MDGFKRPNRPVNPVPPAAAQPSRHTMPIIQQSTVPTPDSAPVAPDVDMRLETQPQKPVTVVKRRKKWPFILLGIVVLLAILIGGAYMWYTTQLQPVDSKNTAVQRVEIKDGASFSYVAGKLQERGLIRSSLAFNILANLEGKQGAVQAGTCNLTPAEPAREILDKITKGCNDFTSVTFYPGATLEPSLYARTKAAKEGSSFKDFSIRASLQAAGFSDSEITAAFAADYTGPLFAGRPSGEGLEGYIFGETYYVDTKATAKEVIQVALDHMYDLIKANDLVAKFKAQGLDLYHGITLSSVVQKELDCEGKPTKERKDRCYGYQEQIARVFYNRIQLGMSLGSDVTSIYASDKLGVSSSIDVDSPYNTRKYSGMPPGPIATPGKLALLATAEPTKGDELFFLAGDDGLIYFATNEAGHNANIKNHCQVLCGEL